MCTAHLSGGLVDDAAVRDLWKPWHADALCGICPRETSKEEIREEGKKSPEVMGSLPRNLFAFEVKYT